jgi:hypothetical protein
MPNIHTPERQPDEKQKQYRERQARSRDINDRMTLRGAYNPASARQPGGTPAHGLLATLLRAFFGPKTEGAR